MAIKAIIWKDKTITYKKNNKVITTKINKYEKSKYERFRNLPI